MPEPEHVTIDIFGALGGHVTQVVNRRLGAGTYTVQFNASGLPSGSYVYRMTAGAFTQTRQMTVLK